MFHGKWGIKEGFAACGGLAVVGVALQLCVGPVHWSSLAWPANAWVLTAYLSALVAVYAFGRKSQAVRWAMSMGAAMPALAAVIAFTLVLGLVKQTSTGGSVFNHLLTFWPFALAYAWMATVLGLVSIKHLCALRVRELPFLLNHLGLFIVLLAATLGSADMQRLRMVTRVGSTEWRAYDRQGELRELPLGIELNEFCIDEYPPKLLLIDYSNGQVLPGQIILSDGTNGGELPGWTIEVLDRIDMAVPMADSGEAEYVESPGPGAACAVYVRATSADGAHEACGWVSCGSFAFPYQELPLDGAHGLAMPDREPSRFASRVAIHSEGGKWIDATIEVNKPVRVGGWKIYQLGYDESMGRWSDISVLELVSDPWQQVVYVGFIMMMLGAVCMFAIPRRLGAKGKVR